MKIHRLTVEHALYGLAFLLALGLRISGLGAAPLNNFEAGWALQALELSGRGQAQGPLSVGPNPGYSMITGLLFFLLGSSNGLARFWPALAGALLVFVPALFRSALGKRAALILALGLALDPGLLAVSRAAGEAMPALAFGLLALGATYQRKAGWAGLLGGLALLSGPAVLTGVLGFALAWAASRLLGGVGRFHPLPGGELGPEDLGSAPALDSSGMAPLAPGAEAVTVERAAALRLGAYLLLGTILLIGTLFFRFPQGLGGLAGTLTAYLDGWTSPSGVPALQLPLALLVYQPLPLILGLVAAGRGWLAGKAPAQRMPASGAARLLSLWTFFALLLPVLYPARQPGDFIWVLVPLWALAALELADDLFLEVDPQNRLIVIGQTVLLLILLAFSWNYLLVMISANLLSGATALRSFLVLIFAAAGMGAVTTVLVALGWSWPVSRKGLVWGAVLALGLYMLAASWGVAQVRPAGAQELWSRLPAAGEEALLARSLADVSQWKTGQPHMLDVVVLVDSPALRWTLRDWPNAHYVSDLSPTELPSAIVTGKTQESPVLAASYRGQDFPWETYRGWEGLVPADLARWLAFRQGPGLQNEVILWVRADLFPGTVTENQADVEIVPEEELGP